MASSVWDAVEGGIEASMLAFARLTETHWATKPVSNDG